MKKIVSFLLLLAMVLGCFAGCAPEAATEDPGLIAAKDYLYAMYKDSDAKTAVDYSVVGQVRIEDVVYPITWTVDKTDNVQITTGENNMVFVKLIPGTEDINYKLTATLKNANGQEASVSFDHFIPKADGAAVTLADGTYVILAGNLTMSSLSADKSYGYPYATEVTVADGAVSGYTAADVLTIKNVDGGFTIQDAQGRYFYLKGTYNSFNVDATAPAEGHIFSILSKDGKYLIQNNLEKKTLAYSTSYSSWGCYPELTDDHTSLVDIIAVTASDATPAPDSGNNNSGNTGNNNTGSTGGDSTGGNTSGGNTVETNKTSATLYYSAEKLYITGKQHIYEAKNKYELILSEKKADAIALTIKTNSDKTISFVSGKNYLYCDGTDVKFVTKQSDNTKFVLESAGDGKYFIKCAVATYQDKAQYLEVYSGYLTCFGMGSDASIYTFELKDTSGAKGKVTAASNSGGSSSGGSSSGGSSSGGSSSGGSSSGGSSSGGSSSGSSSSKPNTSISTPAAGKGISFDFISLDKKGTEIAAEEALSVFQSVASADGLTAVEVTKIYNGNSTGGAYEQTAGLIRCGKSDTEGELVLTFSKNVAKVEILCHDWYAKSDSYPTNSNYIAVNGSTAQLAPYTADPTPAVLTFELDGTSNVVDFDFSNTQSGRTGRVFIFQIVVTFE